jgi:predicted DNA-binding protein YlxM (UPF0122 family)
MKENPVEMALLFDFYGDVLTEKQREYFQYYHSDDLSLSEIAQNEGISRQGARDSISRTETILKEMEEKLGLVSRFLRIQKDFLLMRDAAGMILAVNERRYMNADIRDKAKYIQTLAEKNSYVSDENQPPR